VVHGDFSDHLSPGVRAGAFQPSGLVSAQYRARSNRSAALYLAKRSDEAIQQLRTTLTKDPEYWYAHAYLGRVYARTGRFREGIAEQRAAQRLMPLAEVEAFLGRTYADAGDRVEATKVLNHLRARMRDEFVSPGYTLH
jgi:predicted Zn-dependent protease